MFRITVRSRRIATIATAITISVAGAMTAADARAAIFCVNAPTCSGNTAASIAQALSDAAAVPGEDRIEIGSGVYDNGPWKTDSANVVRIVGVGPTKPLLTGPLGVSDDAVLELGATGSTVSNVDLVIPSGTNGKFGLYATKTLEASGVGVTGSGAVNPIGIMISGHQSSKITDSAVDLPCGPGNDSQAVYLTATTSTKIYTSELKGCFGLFAEDSESIDVQRATVRAHKGLEFRKSSGTVSSSLIRYTTPVQPSSDYGIRLNNTSGLGEDAPAAPGDSTPGDGYRLNVINNTLIGHGGPGIAIASAIGALGGENTIRADSNVIVGWSETAQEDSSNANGYTDLSIIHSRYDKDPALGTTTGSELAPGDLGFVDVVGGDYSLKRGSPLVDAGNPNSADVGAQPIPAGRDLAGKDRLVNAVGTDAPRVDIGAYEVQNAAPTAQITVLTSDPRTGFAVQFSAAGSTEPDGDALTYAWSFDDGSTASGPTAERLWNVTGIQTVRLTVTDSTGLNHSTSVPVTLKKGVAKIALPRTAAKVDRQGRFAYRLRCPALATGSCSGRLTFKTASKIDTKRYGANTLRAKKKIVKAAQYVFTIKPGRTKTLRVRTYRTFLKLLKKKRRVALRVTLNGRADNVDLSATPTTFVVRR